MTTKPKAKRFRIRRSPAAQAAAEAAGARAPGQPPASPAAGAADSPLGAQEDGFGPAPFPTARAAGEAPAPGTAASPAPGQPARPAAGAPAGAAAAAARAGEGPAPSGEGPKVKLGAAEEIAAIRREGLTGRQLRMARRLAQKHGLAPTSDFDAVRLLRNRGIDPFQRANLLELVVSEGRGQGGAAAKPAPGATPNLPQTVPPPGSEEPDPVSQGAARMAEILEIQRDIARRRRRRVAMLFARLAVFVLLPTLVAAYYYYVVATPMYATKSEFVIQQADGQGGGGMGGLLSGTGLATSQDSITVQSYLQSREAMLRLDADLNYKAHFSDPSVDPIQRLDADATNEEAYKLFQRNVKIGYDPTEGIVRMEVSAFTPEDSAAFSRALIGYAEEQVDNLTQRLREDQMQGANDTFAEAEAKMIAAQERVLELQERLGVLDPASETSALMGQISNFEVQLAEKRLQLQQLLDNPSPNQARVSGVEGDIARLENLIGDLRGQLTESNAGAGSLAQVTGQLRMAEVDLETRTMMMQEALQSLEVARVEANRQVRYLSLGVNPVPPDEPTYPRAFENTVLAFLIFSGIYLMASLTASILREQVSG